MESVEEELQDEETLIDADVNPESEVQSLVKLSPELELTEDEKKCSCEGDNCVICSVNTESSDKTFDVGSVSQLPESTEVRQCKYCGQQFRFLFAYRKHHLKCWRMHLRKAAMGMIENRTDNKNSIPKKIFALSNNSARVKRNCNVCGLNFRSQLRYDLHIHNNICRPPPFICNKCGKVFKRLRFLINHEKRKIPCVLSTKKVLSVPESSPLPLAGTEIAEENEKKPNKFKCNRCNAQFSLFCWYSKHISQPNGCRLKTKKLSNTPQIRYRILYLEKFKTSRGYKCKRCGRFFQFPSRLRDHLMRKIPCIGNSKRSTLPTNVTVNSNNQKIDISVNNDQFKKKESAKTANAKVGRKIIRKYWKIASTQSKQYKQQDDLMNKYGSLICCICNKKFFNSYTWNNHLKIHSGEKCSVKCPVCQSVFRSAYTLYCHQKKTDHWGKLMKSRINNCQCPFCGKKFAYVGSRKNHIQLHLQDYPSEVKEFLNSTTCSLCNIHFVTEAKKTAHIKKQHLNIEPSDKKQNNYNNNNKMVIEDNNIEGIGILPKGKPKMKREVSPTQVSSQSKKLLCSTITGTSKKNKLKIKSAESIYPCALCVRKFTRFNHLVRHQQTIHKNCLNFQCSICNQNFFTRSIINQHIRKYHKNVTCETVIIEIDKNVSDIAMKSEINEYSVTEQTAQLPPANQNLLAAPRRKVYFCEVCNEDGYRRISSLRRHKRTKQHRDNVKRMKQENVSLSYKKSTTELPIVICSVCKQSFDSVSSFVPHRLNHLNFQQVDQIETTESMPYCCEVCSKIIHHHQKIQSHLLGHLRVRKKKVLRPNSINFITATDVTNTSDIQHSLPKLAENNLDFQIGQQDNIAEDNKNSVVKRGRKMSKKPRRNDNFICKKCNKSFRTKRLYTVHVRYRCRFQLACEQCNAQFPSKKLYLIHKTHSGCKRTVDKLHCQYCSLDFSSVSDLRWHEKSCQKVHGTETGNFNFESMNNLFQCKYCHMPFLTSQTCEEHENNYCEKSLYCSICKSFFSSLELLNKHKTEYHTSESSYNCLVCGIRFHNKEALDSHTKSHGINDQIVNYDECDENSSRSKTIKTFPCPHCGKTYEKQYKLKEHLVTHSPFNCPVCGKTETSINGFRKHPCHLSNDTFAPDTIYEKKPKKATVPKKIKLEKKCAQSISEFKNDNSSTCEEADQVSCQETSAENCVTSNDSNEFENKLPLDILRDNFSQLLYLFVADPELMTQLGWGRRLIDDVLEEVLNTMGQHSIGTDTMLSEVERLRTNIQILLRVCIKDQILDAVDGENKSVDEIVVEMLRICKESLEDQTTLLNVAS